MGNGGWVWVAMSQRTLAVYGGEYVRIREILLFQCIFLSSWLGMDLKYDNYDSDYYCNQDDANGAY